MEKSKLKFNRIVDLETDNIREPDLIWKYFHYNTRIMEGKQLFYVPSSFSDSKYIKRNYIEEKKFDFSEDFIEKNHLKKAIYYRTTNRNYTNRKISFNSVQNIIQYSMKCKKYNEDSVIENMLYPSAGARFPHELYLIVFNVEGLKKGIYHYDKISNTVGLIELGDMNEEFNDALLNQVHVRKASGLLILTADICKTTMKYGDRGYRYVLLDAGHIGQNLYLNSIDEGCNIVAVGGFNDCSVSKLLNLERNEFPIYAFSIG